MKSVQSAKNLTYGMLCGGMRIFAAILKSSMEPDTQVDIVDAINVVSGKIHNKLLMYVVIIMCKREQ